MVVFVVSYLCFDLFSPMGKWFTLTRQYFSDGLVQPPTIFLFIPEISEQKIPQRIFGTQRRLKLHFSWLGRNPQVDVALLALARALWRGRFPEVRGPGSAALEATRKTMRTPVSNDGGIHHGDGYLCIYIGLMLKIYIDINEIIYNYDEKYV